jgi:hypothetical protein
LRWKLPRELLWAIIFSLAIFVAALWPSRYPYSQVSKISSQDQAENSIGGDHASAEPSSAPIGFARNQQSEQRRENASEITFLGIKPGEWLLAIVTWMLWLATVRLVNDGKRTAERQLRAYVSVESGGMFRQSRKRRLRFEFRPNVINNGQTPANDVRIVSFLRISAPAIPDSFDYSLLPIQGSVNTIGPRQGRFHSIVASQNLAIPQLREIQKGSFVFHIYGKVTYSDIFGVERATNFSFIIFPGKSSQGAVWHYTPQHNDAT